MITWKQFKEAVEKEGVKDDTNIDYIDWDGYEDVTVKVFNESVSIT